MITYLVIITIMSGWFALQWTQKSQPDFWFKMMLISITILAIYCLHNNIIPSWFIVITATLYMYLGMRWKTDTWLNVIYKGVMLATSVSGMILTVSHKLLM